MKDALQQMRIIRNAYLKDYDSEVIKYTAMGTPIPTSLATYLQELRDLPLKSTPTLDPMGNLDMDSVTFPKIKENI